MQVNIEKILLKKENFEREYQIKAQQINVTMKVKILASKIDSGKDEIKTDIEITGNDGEKKLFALMGEYIIYYNPDEELRALDIKDKGNVVFEEAYNTELKDRFKSIFEKADLLNIVLPDV